MEVGEVSLHKVLSNIRRDDAEARLARSMQGEQVKGTLVNLAGFGNVLIRFEGSLQDGDNLCVFGTTKHRSLSVKLFDCDPSGYFQTAEVERQRKRKSKGRSRGRRGQLVGSGHRYMFL